MNESTAYQENNENFRIQNNKLISATKPKSLSLHHVLKPTDQKFSLHFLFNSKWDLEHNGIPIALL